MVQGSNVQKFKVGVGEKRSVLEWAAEHRDELLEDWIYAVECNHRNQSNP
jgi:hypothetical protein